MACLFRDWKSYRLVHCGGRRRGWSADDNDAPNATRALPHSLRARCARGDTKAKRTDARPSNVVARAVRLHSMRSSTRSSCSRVNTQFMDDPSPSPLGARPAFRVRCSRQPPNDRADFRQDTYGISRISSRHVSYQGVLAYSHDPRYRGRAVTLNNACCRWNRVAPST